MNQTAANPKHVVIIGAGIVGVSTATWLQRAGHRVTIIDREGPAAGTSYGNAGILAAIAIVPVPVPGITKKAPGMLLDKNSPLFMRWSYFPKLIPFLFKFLGNAKHEKVTEISTSLSTLLSDCAEQHASLAKGTSAEKFVKQGDYLFGYADKAAFDADAYGWGIRKKNNHPFEEMTGEELGEYDPTLKGLFGHAVKCPQHGHITDPGAYVKALAEDFVKNGGTIKIADVLDIAIEAEQASGVQTSNGFVEADDVVMATGVWSGPLADKLGLSVPLEAERGYHIEFINPSIKPKAPIMVASGKYVMTPMEGRLRCAGIVEFGGLSEEKSKAALDLLKRQTLKLLPDLTYDRIEEWMGFRPSTSDSLPLIGAVNNAKNVWSAFGHQHIGLSAGPKTGRWIAQMISGQMPNEDLTPFAPNRFQSGNQNP